MFIFEGNRIAVTHALKGVLADMQVARACSDAGARLDGSDSVLTLCAVDDLLHERVGFVASPLQPPAEYEDPAPPRSLRPSALDRLVGFRRAVKRAKTRGEAPPAKATYDAEFVAKKDRVADEWARYHATPRYFDSDRARVERAIADGTIDVAGMVQALAQDPSRRADHREFSERMRQLRARVEEINEFGNRLFSAFSHLGFDQMLCFSSVDPDDVHELVSRSLGDPLTADANAERVWLTEQLRIAAARPPLLSCRSERASRIAGRAAPYVSHGPASLLEAAEEWLRRWTPLSAAKLAARTKAQPWSADLLTEKLEDEYSLEGDARAQLAQAAGNVVELLASIAAWHEEAGHAGRTRRHRMIRSLDAVFNACVSFDGGLPPRQVLQQLIVEGAFNVQPLAIPMQQQKKAPKRRNGRKSTFRKGPKKR